MRRLALGMAVGFQVMGLGFFTVMTIRIVTGEGDYKYDAIMGMLNLVASIGCLNLARK